MGIQHNINNERIQMQKAVVDGSLRFASDLDKKDTHQLAIEKEREIAAFEKALKIDKSSHEHGAAFDQELQAQKKLERMQLKAEQEQAKLEAGKKAEKAQKKA